MQPIQRLQPNSITDGVRNFMAQLKQRKQLILTDNKNISTYHFEPMQCLQANFITDGIRNFMAQQKQCKQVILTDNNNISTYHFQSVQHLQPNFMTDGIRNFMYTKQNEDNAKLRIFFFIPQRQRIQTNFMNDNIGTFIHTKQLNTDTQLEQPNSAVFIFKLRKKLADFIHFIHHKFCTFHRPSKICT